MAMPLMYVLWGGKHAYKEGVPPAQGTLNHSHYYATMISGYS